MVLSCWQIRINSDWVLEIQIWKLPDWKLPDMLVFAIWKQIRLIPDTSMFKRKKRVIYGLYWEKAIMLHSLAEKDKNIRDDTYFKSSQISSEYPWKSFQCFPEFCKRMIRMRKEVHIGVQSLQCRKGILEIGSITLILFQLKIILKISSYFSSQTLL